MLALFSSNSAAEDDVFDDAEAEAPAPRATQVTFRLSDSNFDRWAFGDRLSPDDLVTSLDEALSRRIEEVDQEFPLTQLQKDKLRLAGRGDINRYWKEVEEKRRLFDCWKTDRNRLTDLQREISALQGNSPSRFAEDSLFFKAVSTTLSIEQAAQYRAHYQEKRRRFFRPKLELYISMLDRALALTDDQRQQLSTLLNEQIRPPRVSGPYDTIYISIQMSKLPETSLRPIFDDRQWTVLITKFATALRSEPILQRLRIEPDAPTDIAPPAKPRPGLLPDDKRQEGDERGE